LSLKAVTKDLHKELDLENLKTQNDRQTKSLAETTRHGSTSWVAFRRQFEAAGEHNYWALCEKATYLIAALNRLASLVGRRTKRFLWRLRIANVTTTWKKRSTLS
jgi:hypothetical protein